MKPQTTPRFAVVDGSQSAHWFFRATVIDTEKPVMIGGEHYRGQFEPVCECFTSDQATLIANALNTKGARESYEEGYVDGASMNPRRAEYV